MTIKNSAIRKEARRRGAYARFSIRAPYPTEYAEDYDKYLARKEVERKALLRNVHGLLS